MMMMMIHRELRLHRPNWFSPFLDTHGMNSIETTTSIEDMTRDTAALQASHNSSPNSFSVQRKQDVVVESFAHLPRGGDHTAARPEAAQIGKDHLFCDVSSPASHPAILKSLPRDDIFFRLLLCVVLLLRVLRADDDYFRQQSQSKRRRQRLYYYFIKYVGI